MVKSMIMKKTVSVLITTMCLMATATMNLKAQINTSKTKTKKMETVKESKEVVQGFFNAFGKGDFNGIINAFDDSATLIAVRDANRNESQIYGKYKGKEGAKAFISNLGKTFDTKAFSVDNIIGEGNIVFANGKFTHSVKSSGKSFSSDWVLMCVIKDEKILEYHFYEDSEKFVEANK
jgi:hypothetical protein